MNTHKMIYKLLMALSWALFYPQLMAQEADIRKALAQSMPEFPVIEEIRKTALPGLYELRVKGSEILYSDAKGQYLIQGQVFDVRNKKNLTQERVDKLLTVDLTSLPTQDAITLVRGKGERKLVVFSDPNCGFCKRFEQQIQNLDNVTIRVHLYPILGEDSSDKSKRIWCSKTPGKTWADWMLKDKTPAKASCDTTAIDRNLAWGQKNKVQGTPLLVLADGSRIPGAIDAASLEARLGSIAK